jgi:hypothetical protein
MFIKDLIGITKNQNEKLTRHKFKQENMDIYIKGGTVLGLKVLSMIYEKYGHDKVFEEKFNEFKKLELIRDWDFAYYLEGKEITEAYRANLDKIARTYKLVPRAKTFILYQSKYPIKINDQALFEISILQSNNIVDLELPLTTMKVKINRRNLLQIFMLAKCFYSSDPIDLNVIKHIIKDMRILIPEASNGLFVRHKLDRGNLSKKLIELIINFSRGNINLQEFFVTHIQEPNRLLYRLLEKNIPKNNKIKSFLQQNNMKKEKISWLLNTDYIMKQVDMFIQELGSTLDQIITNGFSKNKSKLEIIEYLDDFLEGINLDRIKIEYETFTEKALSLLRVWFGETYTKLFAENDDIFKNRDSKLVKIMSFMIKQNLFENN